MRITKKYLGVYFSVVGLIVLILDARTAINGAQEGLQICIHTVIPSLFPFFVLSGVINSYLVGVSIPFLRPIGRLCRVPVGSESILLLGLIGGYPVGARLVRQAYDDKKIDLGTAERMLGFCNNAGPSFLFGILGPLFHNQIVPWVLWVIHISSALVVGIILPGGGNERIQMDRGTGITVTQSLKVAVKTMASVCGWVIVFRTVIAFCSRWFLWILPPSLQVLFSGLLELSNGCVLLQILPSESVRFILAGVMISFGGLCVLMQTVSVAGQLGNSLYFPGKVLQAALTFLLSYPLQQLLFPGEIPLKALPAFLCAVMVLLAAYLVFRNRKKVVAFKERVLYNNDNTVLKGARICFSGKK